MIGSDSSMCIDDNNHSNIDNENIQSASSSSSSSSSLLIAKSTTAKDITTNISNFNTIENETHVNFMLNILKDYPEHDIEAIKDEDNTRAQNRKLRTWLQALESSNNPKLKQIMSKFLTNVDANNILKTIKGHEIEILKAAELEKGISDVDRLLKINDYVKVPVTGTRNLSTEAATEDIGNAHALIGSIMEIVDAAARASCEFKQANDVLRLQAVVENDKIAYYKSAQDVLTTKASKLKSKHEVSEKERFQEINNSVNSINSLESEEKKLIDRLKRVREELVTAKKNHYEMKDRTLFGRLAEKTKISIVTKQVARCDTLINEAVRNQDMFKLFNQFISDMTDKETNAGDEMPLKKKKTNEGDEASLFFPGVDLLSGSKADILIQKILSWLKGCGPSSSAVFDRYLYEGISVSRILMKKYTNHEIFSTNDDLAYFMKSLKYSRNFGIKKDNGSNDHSMTTLVICDPRNLKHLVPKGFPERSLRIVKIIDRLIKLQDTGLKQNADDVSVESHANAPVPVIENDVDTIRNEKTEIRCISMNEKIPMHDCFYACISLAHADGYIEFLKERCAVAQSLSRKHIPIKDTAIRIITSEGTEFELDPSVDIDFTDADLKAVAESLSNDELPSTYQKKQQIRDKAASPRQEPLSLKVPKEGDVLSRLDSPKPKHDGTSSKNKAAKSKVVKKDKKEVVEEEEKKVETVWSCSNCTYDNNALTFPKYCEICNYRRPGYSRQQSRGQTPRSDSIAEAKTENNDKPSSKTQNHVSTNKKIVTWACPLCKFSENDVEIGSCSQCSSPRTPSPRNVSGLELKKEDASPLVPNNEIEVAESVPMMVDEVREEPVITTAVTHAETNITANHELSNHNDKKQAMEIPENKDVLILDSRAKRQREVEGITDSKIDESQIVDILELQTINQRSYVGDKWLKCYDGTVIRGPGFWTELDGDADTYISAESFDAAVHAAFVVCNAVDAIALGVARGKLLPLEGGASTNQDLDEVTNIQNVFCCIRPPGHHAGRFGSTGGCVQNGFCLLNNVAIAAYYARIQYGYRRIAIVDIDAHFGNGTAEIFDGDPNTFYSSIHLQYEGPKDFFYPSTSCCVMGADTSEPNSAYVNIYPMKGPAFNLLSAEPKLRGREGFRKGFTDTIIPALIKFEPDIIFVSAGFDGASSDPVGGQLGLKPKDFSWSASILRKVADDICGGRLISVLEGGYDISKLTNGLSQSAEAHVKGIAGWAGQ